jgi:DNA-binding SARP family transcriptional activator/tetratricopeptide (TPR) repeat protein
VEFRVLGPVELWVAGDRVELGPPKQRVVLAALLVDAGRAVPAETIINRVWGDAPPAEVRNVLYSYVNRLRRAMSRPAAGDREQARLERGSGGYVMLVDPDQVDLHRFRRLVARARGPDRTDDERARLLDEALGVWRGQPLAGLPGDWATRMRASLEQQRLDAVLLWAEVAIRQSRYASVVEELRELQADHLLVEPLTGHLIRALYLDGRGTEALDCYAKARRHFIDELGTEPGLELRRVHEAVLRGTLERPVPARPVSTSIAPAQSPTASFVVPAQLPADLAGFTGRAAHLRQLDALVSDAPGRAVVISVIAGTAGVGKTALAVHWAHRVRDRFPDGQLYVNLRGFDPTGTVTTPAEAVHGFLDALAVAPERIPADLHAQGGLYRSLLAGRRMLVVLDNARDAEQVRQLLPGAPGCLVLVTSRSRLSGLVASAGAHLVSLDLLTRQESAQLLACRLGADRLAAEPHAAEEIITACARLPLALAIVAARAATHPHFLPLAGLAGELRDGRDRLDALSTGDEVSTDVRAVFSWSYRQLGAAAGRLFRLLGLHPGPDISAPAAASLAGLPAPAVRPLLAELTRTHLVGQHSPGRYTFHDLLRTYAADLTHATDPDADRLAAVHRMLDHYLHTAHAADRLLHPARDPITLPPPGPDVTPEQPVDHHQAFAWFAAEHPVLLATVEQAAGTGCDIHTWQLAWALDTFLDRRGHWHDQAAVQRTAVAAARRLADPAAQARAHRLLGRAHLRLGRLDEAHTHLRDALDLFREAGDAVGQARAHTDINLVWDRQGRQAEALDHALQALELFRAAGHRAGQAIALNSIGWLHTVLGNHEQALTYCQQALTLLQGLGNRSNEANTCDSLGYAHHHLGHHTQAVTCYHQALDLFRDLGDRYNDADTRSRLGDTHQAAGNSAAARAAWQQALTILEDLDHPDAEQLRTKLHQLDRPTPPTTPPVTTRPATTGNQA